MFDHSSFQTSGFAIRSTDWGDDDGGQNSNEPDLSRYETFAKKKKNEMKSGHMRTFRTANVTGKTSANLDIKLKY